MSPAQETCPIILQFLSVSCGETLGPQWTVSTVTVSSRLKKKGRVFTGQVILETHG